MYDFVHQFSERVFSLLHANATMFSSQFVCKHYFYCFTLEGKSVMYILEKILTPASSM